jgi:hypothetical protein
MISYSATFQMDTGIGSTCYATEQDWRHRGWRRQHLAQPHSRTGQAIHAAAHRPGYRPQHPSHRGLRARGVHAAATWSLGRGAGAGHWAVRQTRAAAVAPSSMEAWHKVQALASWKACNGHVISCNYCHYMLMDDGPVIEMVSM